MIHFEVQYWWNTSNWFWTVTISRDEHYWTSRPMMLSQATEQEARAEIARQIIAFKKTLGVD